jgi:predicted nucleotidyltransferase
MLNKRTAKKIVKDYIEACKERNILFNKVILFGSVISGKNNEFSDIDIALVSDQFTGNPITDWNMLVPINIRFDDIEPHPYRTKYFEAGDAFIDEVIKKEGIEIPLN